MVNKLDNFRKLLLNLSYDEKRQALKMVREELKVRHVDKESALKWWYSLSTHKKMKLTKKWHGKGVLWQKRFQNLTAKDVHKMWVKENV